MGTRDRSFVWGLGLMVASLGCSFVDLPFPIRAVGDGGADARAIDDAGLLDAMVPDASRVDVVAVVDVLADAGTPTDAARDVAAIDVPADLPPACPDMQTLCGVRCTATQTDPLNCGGCGQACVLPNVAMSDCLGGRCTIMAGGCARGFSDCDGVAANGCETNLATNTNCGSCGNACASGTMCMEGACVSSCTGGTTFCGGICVSTSTDSANCGGCGRACPASQVCTAGSCVCPGSGTLCAAACVNTLTDTTNCGACGNVCAPGRTCTSGTCACPAGQTNCGGTCSTLTTDAANCGACGAVCTTLPHATGVTCASGTCGYVACSPGFGNCDGIASDGCETDIQTSSANCGACGRTCALPNATSNCSTGACAVNICNTNFANCNGVASDGCEVNTLSDSANCGTCAHACTSGTVCSAGVCSTPSAQPSCPTPTERGCGTVSIPAGSFVMGGDSMSYYARAIAGTMTISAFHMDAYEVTVARFRRFWNASPTPHPGVTGTIAYPGGSVTWGGPVTEPFLSSADGNSTWSESAGSLEAHPINDVDWYTAQAFCVWDGGRLPTEAEWEYAARGTSLGGLTPERYFPWGNTAPSTTCDLAEWNGCTGDDGNGTKRVGSFASSPVWGGLFDMAGNVGEWNADWYANYGDATCWSAASSTNPICNNSATGYRVFRGGSLNSSIVAPLRSASRDVNSPPFRNFSVGFRCARTP